MQYGSYNVVLTAINAPVDKVMFVSVIKLEMLIQ